MVGALAIVISGAPWFPSASTAGSESAAALLVSGAQASAAKDWGRCVTLYSRAISAAPSSSTAFAGRGQCEYQGGDYQSSVNDLNRAISLNGAGAPPSLLFARARANDAMGDDGAAVADYMQIIKGVQSTPVDVAVAIEGLRIVHHVPGAVAAGILAAGRYPGAWQVHDQLAISEISVGDVSAATAEFTKALTVAPDNPSKATVFHDRAEVEQTQGEVAAGLGDATQAIALDPRWEYFRTRAEIREALNDLNGALADLTKAVDVDRSSYPDNKTVRVWLLDERGSLLLNMGRKSAAAADFSAALTMSSDPVARARLSNELAEAR